jgi:hypothetical protein
MNFDGPPRRTHVPQGAADEARDDPCHFVTIQPDEIRDVVIDEDRELDAERNGLTLHDLGRHG